MTNQNLDSNNNGKADDSDALGGTAAKEYALLGQIGVADLSFDPATQSDLHSRYTDSEAQSAVDGTARSFSSVSVTNAPADANDAIRQQELTSHADDPGVHHPEYTDAKAQSAIDGTARNLSDLSIGGQAAQFGLDGMVVPIGQGLGPADAVPVSDTNPVNDAIDKIVATGRGGTVLLPIGTTTQAQAVSMHPGIRLIGQGVGDTDTAEGSVLHITGSGEHGIELYSSVASGISGFEGWALDEFVLRGPGVSSTTGRAIQFGDPALTEADREKVRFFTIGRLMMEEWHNNLIRCEAGAAPWSFRVDHLQAQGYDSSTATNNCSIDFIDDNSLAQRWGVLDLYPGAPNADSTVQDIIRIGAPGDMIIDTLNVGTAAKQAFQTAAGWGQVIINTINYEPGALATTSRPTICMFYGSQKVRVNSVVNRVQNDVSVNNCYRFEGGGTIANKWLATPMENPSHPFTGDRVNIGASIGKDVVYEGHSADLINNTGATLSNGVSCLGDLVNYTG